MNDLLLKYQFTDRAGRGVYTIIADAPQAPDAPEDVNVLGQMRLHLTNGNPELFVVEWNMQEEDDE